MPVTRAELEAAGYRRYDNTTGFKFAHALWQKRFRSIRNPQATLYFINFYEYLERTPDVPAKAVYSAEAPLYPPTGDDASWFAFEVHSPMSVSQVETCVLRVYLALGCVPDPHN
jgi:hypothetical protein